MSATIAPPLAEAEKVDARRFLGYPAYGSGPNDDSFGRYFGAYPTMEYRLANLEPDELVTIRARLAALTLAETQLEAMGATLIVDTAAVFKRNANELTDRQRFFDGLRRRLCGFIGVPPGPYLAASANSVRLVV